jgi:hypothetical protein
MTIAAFEEIEAVEAMMTAQGTIFDFPANY